MTGVTTEEEEKLRMLKAIKLLNELVRQAKLREEGFSITAIAEQLGLSRVTVFGRQRILRKLARKNINRR